MKKCYLLLIITGIFLSIIFINSGVCAQEISVYIDGRKVFFDVPPAKIEGRTLVPLRAIFQGLGAFVEYDAPSRTITATKGNIKIQLTLDSTKAYVNGQARTLDIPAMSKSGRTLVPLRFVGEAFGARVKWEGSTQSIFIETEDMPVDAPSPVPTPDVPVTSQPVIYSLTHNATSEVGPGYAIEVTLIGTSGGDAKFSIANLVNNVPMFEKSNGVYTGSYTVKKTDSVNNSTLTGYLTVNGNSAESVSADVVITLSSEDIQPDELTIYSVTHNGENTLASGNVITVTLIGTTGCSAYFDIGNIIENVPMFENRTGVYEGSYTVKMTDKGESLPVTGRLTKNKLSASPVSAAEKVNIGKISENIIIYTISHDGSHSLQPGEVLNVTLVGTSGGKATFNIGKSIKGISMTEIQPGVYQGNYTVKSTDSVSNAIIYGYLSKGNVSSPGAQATDPVTLGSLAPEPVEEIKIYSITHDVSKPLKVGDELKVILVGVSGGTASFDISNFRSGISMNEIQPGVYQGVYKVTGGDSVTDAVLIGHLSKGNSVAPVIQAGVTLTISGISPKVAEVYPEDGAVIGSENPVIYITFDTKKGTIINPDTAKLLVDGLDVSAKLVKASSFISYYPDVSLPARRNIWVELTAMDNNGNQVFHRWYFTIVPRMQSIISSAYHNGQLPLKSGEKLQVTMFGNKGAGAWFEIEGLNNNIPMTEVNPGTYFGEYIINSSDNIAGGKVIAHLKTAKTEDTLIVEPPVTFDIEKAFTAPSIVSLQDGQTVPFPLVIEGYTSPFATVNIKYEYKASFLGSPIMLQGVSGTNSVSADEKGYFTDKNYSVWGSGTYHKITVTAVNTSGEVSPATVINVIEQ